MKLSVCLSSCLLAATVSAKRYTSSYDTITADAPRSLSKATTRLPSKTFGNLNYGTTDAYLVQWSGSLLSDITPPSSPNILAVQPVPLGMQSGSIAHTASDTEIFNVLAVRFACMVECEGLDTPVQCTVLFADSNGNTISETYDGSSEMTNAVMLFQDIRSVAFTVTDADVADVPDAPLYLLLDDWVYELDAKSG